MESTVHETSQIGAYYRNYQDIIQIAQMKACDPEAQDQEHI